MSHHDYGFDLFTGEDFGSSSSSSDELTTSPTPAELRALAREKFLKKKISLARSGHLPLRLPEYLHHHHTYLSPREFAKLTLVGLWCAQLNLGRKGDATKLIALGRKIFGADELDLVVNEAISLGGGKASKDGFGRIDIEKFLGFQKDVCWGKPRKKGVPIVAENRLDIHMSQKLISVAWGAMVQLRRMGDADFIEEMGREQNYSFDGAVEFLVRYAIWGQRVSDFD